ncbi:MAG: hypothetical protein M3Z00_08400 [Actinomycetota bacterium]|nr:hypothetical protein [Actinomycetota bacterium]
MKTSNRSYAMAMLAGLAIIGAATAGVSIAQSHQATAAAEVPAAPAVSPAQPSSDPGATGAPSISRGSTSAGPDAASPPAGGTPSAAALPSSAAAPPETASAGTPSVTTAAGSPTRGTTAKTPATVIGAPVSTPPATSSAPARPAARLFKDGQYSATGTYNSPGGIQHLGVTITVAADTVTAAKLDLLGDAGVAHSYQTLFASGYSAQVIGKKITSIKLGAVAGSSLTGIGFNMALQQIESQAHA